MFLFVFVRLEVNPNPLFTSNTHRLFLTFGRESISISGSKSVSTENLGFLPSINTNGALTHNQDFIHPDKFAVTKLMTDKSRRVDGYPIYGRTSLP